MKKTNCWQFWQCGREPGGKYTKNYGTCPAASEADADGLNGGTNGGRICWVIAENDSRVRMDCSDLHKQCSCLECEFRYSVMSEEELINVCRDTGSLLNSICP